MKRILAILTSIFIIPTQVFASCPDGYEFIKEKTDQGGFPVFVPITKTISRVYAGWGDQDKLDLCKLYYGDLVRDRITFYECGDIRIRVNPYLNEGLPSCYKGGCSQTFKILTKEWYPSSKGTGIVEFNNSDNIYPASSNPIKDGQPLMVKCLFEDATLSDGEDVKRLICTKEKKANYNNDLTDDTIKILFRSVTSKDCKKLKKINIR